MQVLTEAEVRQLADRLGPHIDARYDHTYGPVFPEGRTDVCAVKRLAENGSSYGFDTLYLVSKRADGIIAHQKIADSRASKDYLHIDSIIVQDQSVTVKYSTGGSFGGKPWQEEFTSVF